MTILGPSRGQLQHIRRHCWPAPGPAMTGQPVRIDETFPVYVSYAALDRFDSSVYTVPKKKKKACSIFRMK